MTGAIGITNSTAAITTGGGVSGTNLIVSRSDLQLDAAGSIAIIDAIGFTDSTAAITTGGAVSAKSFTATKSSLSLAAADSIVLRENMMVTDSVLSMTTEDGSITAQDLLALNSSISLIAGKNQPDNHVTNHVVLHRIYVDGGRFAMDAAGDIRFDALLAVDCAHIAMAANRTVGMRAEGGLPCGEYGTHAFVKLTEEASTLSISALVSLGELESRIILDVPEAVTVSMPVVGNIYVDALELNPKFQLGTADGKPVYADSTMGGENLADVILPELALHPDNPKVNEFEGYDPENPAGNKLNGDYLEFIREQIEKVSLLNQTPEELAAWIVKALDPEIWTDDAFENAEDTFKVFQKDVITELLGSELSNELILDILQKSDLVNKLTEQQRAQLSSGLRFNESGLTQVTTPAELAAKADLSAIFKSLTVKQKQLIGLSEDATGITVEDLIHLMEAEGMTMTQVMGYVKDVAFRADLNLRLNEKKADEILTQVIENNGQAEIYQDIRNNLISGAASDDAAMALLAKLIELKVVLLTAPAAHDPDQPESEEEVPAMADTIFDLEGLLGSVLSEEELLELYIRAIEDAYLNAPAHQDSDARDLSLHIGNRTQFNDTYLYNDGSIVIVQYQGSLTASDIKSERENVTIHVKNGSILADKDTDRHIHGGEVTLNARDDIGTEEAPLVLEQINNRPTVVPVVEKPDQNILELVAVEIPGKGIDGEEEKQFQYVWMLNVPLILQWVRVDYPNEEIRLDAAVETGSIYLKEVSGNTGLGNISAKDTLSIDSNGSILDVRTEEEMAAGKTNISATDALLTANGGTLGSEDRPLLVKLTGEKNDLYAMGDIDVDALGSLTSEIDSVTGKLDVSAEQDLSIHNTKDSAEGTGNLILDNLTAGGSIVLNAVGSILGQSEEPDGKDMESGKDMNLTAGKDIGQKDDALRIDSAQSGSGHVSAFGANITLQETNGDLTIRKVIGTGDVTLDALNGNMDDTTYTLLDEVTQLQQNADTLLNQANAAKVAADSKNLIAQSLKDKAEAAQNRLDELNQIPMEILEIEEQLDDPSLTKQEKAALQRQLNTLTKRQQTLEKTRDADQTAVDAYQAALQDAQDADNAAAAAELAAQSAQAAVAKVITDKLAQLKLNPEANAEEIARLEAIVADMILAREEAEAVSEQARNVADDAQEAADALKPAAEAAQQKLDRLEEINKLLKNTKLTEEERADLEAEKAALRAEKETLKQAIEDHQDAQTEANAKKKQAEDLMAVEAALKQHLDATNDIAAAEQIEADAYQALAEEAAAQAEEAQAYADSLRSGSDKAQQNLPKKQSERNEVLTQIDEVNEKLTDPDLTVKDQQNLQKQLAKLQTQKEQLEDTIEDLNDTIEAYEDAQEAAGKAAVKAEEAQTRARAEQLEAEQSKKKHVPIYAGSNLTITAKGDVGSQQDNMEMTAGGATGGVTSMESQSGSLYTAHSAHVNLGIFSGSNVDMVASGDIRSAASNSGIYTDIEDDPATEEDESLIETKVQINALGSSIGTDEQSLKVDADRISGTSGDNVNIHALGDVTVDQLAAGGSLKLTVDGDIAAGDAKDGAANITGGKIVLNADNVGTEDAPLNIDLIPGNGSFSGNVKDIYLNSTGDLVIGSLKGSNVSVDTDGGLFGDPNSGSDAYITAKNLDIDANNGIGTWKDAFTVNVSGKISAHSLYGYVSIRNVYSVYEPVEVLYDFWDMVIFRIIRAEKNATVEIQEFVPTSYMIARVMQVLQERNDVTLILYLRDGRKLIIKAGTALEPEPGVCFYDMEWLYQYYMEQMV